LTISSSEVFWSAFGAIATAVGAIATFVGAAAILLARRQLRFEAWLKAQDIWTASAFFEARARVFARLDEPDSSWSEAETTEALNVCRKMDEFAGLIPYLPKQTALRIWGVPFAKAWLVLAPIVEKERTKCRWPDKWHAFERLGRLALSTHPEVPKCTGS